MTVTVEVPEEIAAAIQARGESVSDYLLQAAESALDLPSKTVIERRKIIIEQMLADAKGRFLGQSIRSAIDEGRRY